MAFHKFKIVTELTEAGEETTVYLDGEVVFEVDKTAYYGIKRNNTADICKVLEEKLGRPVSKRDLANARMLESIADSEDYE